MTKKKMGVALSFLTFVVMSLLLTACEFGNEQDYPQHTHTFATKWITNEKYHWHICEDAECDEVKDKEEHVFVNGVCVCGKANFSQHLHYRLMNNGSAYQVTNGAVCDDMDIVIPSEYNGIPVISIKDYAFARCSARSIFVPDSVIAIGFGAFSDCPNLESITIPFIGAVANMPIDNINQYPFGYIFGSDEHSGREVKQYYYDELLKKEVSQRYYIPYNLITVNVTNENIPNGAFRDCSFLKNVTLNNKATSIGERAFTDCRSLTSITIPDSVTSIGSYAFSGCNSLASITIPDGVTSIGDYAFFGCSSLTSITIPDGVTSIGDHLFSGCSALTSITIPDSVTSIGERAFYDCSSLTSVTIGNSVTSIGSDAFYGCRSLTSITIPDSVTSIGSAAFYDCSALTSVTIPDSVTSIGEYMFCGCSSLSSITIPDSVTSIGSDAFYGCSSLTSITIPDGVTRIEDYVFYCCNSLTSITIPDSVTSIGERAFYNCEKIARVNYHGTIDQWVQIDFYHSFSNPLYYYAALFISGEKIETINITTAKTINSYAFCGYNHVISVIIDGVLSIGYYAFGECNSIASITFKEPAGWYRVSDPQKWKERTGGFSYKMDDSFENVTRLVENAYYYYYR